MGGGGAGRTVRGGRLRYCSSVGVETAPERLWDTQSRAPAVNERESCSEAAPLS
jgi:hypothetical protein